MGSHDPPYCRREMTQRPQHNPTSTIEEPRPTAERTFLIADVRGYSRFTQERGDQSAAQLYVTFGALVRGCVAANKGRVLRQNGDEVSVVFTSARHALRAALDIQDRCREQTQADPTMPLRAGVGVAAGTVVRVADDYIGEALNLTARLCGLALAGEVLASADAVELARRATGFAYTQRGTATLKGFSAPVPIVRVTREGESAAVEPTGAEKGPCRGSRGR